MPDHSHPAGATPNGHLNGHHASIPSPVIGLEALTPAAAVRRGVKGVPWRVAAVIPGFGKHKDVELLLKDLGRLDLRGIEFWAVLVDNATPNRPLSDVPAPAHLRLEHYRLGENTGGAGGFNAGMARVLAGEGLSAEFEAPDFVWLVDSDARVSRRSLRELVKALIKHKNLCAAGSALVDHSTNAVYEIGGRVSRDRGEWYPAAGGNPDRRILVKCDYLAACSALVRRDAIEQTGLMPDIFIHGDDVQWMVRLARTTGKKIRGVVTSRVYHPHFLGKFQTWTRYYGCRNSFAAIDAMKLGPKVRYRKAMVETQRAVCQSMMGLDELAELHIQGIQDAAACRTKGHHIAMGRDNLLKLYKPQPISTLAAAITEERTRMGSGATVWVHPLLIAHPLDFADLKAEVTKLGLSLKVGEYWKHRHRFERKKRDAVKAFWRAFIAGPTADIAIVPTGWPTGWFRGKVHYEVTPDGFYRRDIKVGERLKKTASIFWRGWKAARAVAARTNYVNDLPPAPQRKATAKGNAARRAPAVQAVSAVGV